MVRSRNLKRQTHHSPITPGEREHGARFMASDRVHCRVGPRRPCLMPPITISLDSDDGGPGAGEPGQKHFFFILPSFSAQNDRFSYWALHLIRLQDSKDLAATNSDLLRFFFETFFLNKSHGVVKHYSLRVPSITWFCNFRLFHFEAMDNHVSKHFPFFE